MPNQLFAPIKSNATASSANSNEPSFHHKYYIGNKVGKGCFGSVYIAIRTKKPGDFIEMLSKEETHRAVKIVDLRHAQGDKQIKVIQNEISIWTRLKGQPNCVRMHEVFRNDGLIYMVMERCGTSLLSYMESFGKNLNERSLGMMFAQMLLGLSQLHACGVVHRDVKPDNFLVEFENGDTVKLCDFGLAKLAKGGKITGECGTAPFMSPEVIGNSKYDEKADMWSFGVVVYVLLFGRFPYNSGKKSSHDMKMAILNGTRAAFGSHIELSSSAISFVMCLLARESAKRPSAVEALRMTYMRSIVASTHELERDLPSLQPCLRLALNLHAFENRELETDDLDEMLNRLQIEALDLPLAETSDVQLQSKARRPSTRRPSSTDGDQCKRSPTARRPSTKSNHSCNSNMSTRRPTVSSVASSDVCSLDVEPFDNYGSTACDV